MSERPVPRPLKVLIADDSKPIADMLAELLAERGRVEVVGSAGFGCVSAAFLYEEQRSFL